MRLEELRGGSTQRELAERLHRRGLKVDKPYMSKLERGYYLPNMETMRALCEELNCGPLDIYDKAEIDLLNALKYPRAVKGSRETERRRISARLPEACCNSLKEALEAEGSTIQSFIERCVERKIKSYLKKKNRAEARRVQHRSA